MFKVLDRRKYKTISLKFFEEPMPIVLSEELPKDSIGIAVSSIDYNHELVEVVSIKKIGGKNETD